MEQKYNFIGGLPTRMQVIIGFMYKICGLHVVFRKDVMSFCKNHFYILTY